MSLKNTELVEKRKKKKEGGEENVKENKKMKGQAGFEEAGFEKSVLIVPVIREEYTGIQEEYTGIREGYTGI